MYYSLVSKLNFRKYTPAELLSMAQDFAEQCQNKLENKPSSLLMLSSLLKKQFPSKDIKQILALDFGGSNLRLGLYDYAAETKKLGLVSGMQIKQVDLEGGKYSLDGLMTTLADIIKNYLVNSGIKSITQLGFTFSFGAEISRENHYVDASREELSEAWAKEFYVEGSKTNISKALRSKLIEDGLNVEKMVTMNDVTSVLLCDSEAVMSMIVGTGYNVGLLLRDKTICNSEAALFTNQFLIDTLSKPAQLLLDEMQVEFKSIYNSLVDFKPKYNEIQISGGYLYKLLVLALCFLGESNLELIKGIAQMETSALSEILNNAFVKLIEMIHTPLPEKDQQVILELVKNIVERASDLVASQIAGSVLFLKQQGLDLPKYVLAADGSVIRYLPGFKEQIENKIKEIMPDVQLEIRLIENSGLLGAAYGVLGI